MRSGPSTSRPVLEVLHRFASRLSHEDYDSMCARYSARRSEGSPDTVGYADVKIFDTSGVEIRHVTIADSMNW